MYRPRPYSHHVALLLLLKDVRSTGIFTRAKAQGATVGPSVVQLLRQQLQARHVPGCLLAAVVTPIIPRSWW
ncbi:hypothetical protein RSAG8_01227, partial [Rhizoctonia solani AG-8 WAC10335]